MEVISLKVILPFLTIVTLSTCYAPGYSFTKFSGPVSGPEKKITVYDDKHHHKTVDYVAKPDYHFAYGVKDPHSKVLQSRKETRRGDAVQGEYSVLDPDGKFRTVKYTADKHNGFQAHIITDGHKHFVQSFPPVPVAPTDHNESGGSEGADDYDTSGNDEGDEEGDGDEEGGDESEDGDEGGDEGGSSEEDYY